MTEFAEGSGAPIVPPVLPSHQEFMDRFPEPILDMIFTHQVRDTPLGAGIRKALLRFQVAEVVDPTDPRTVGSTEAMVDAAIALGDWPAEDRAAALAQILSP